MRAGAPRLGGLGLGGVGATVSGAAARKRKSSKPITPSKSTTPESTLFPPNNLPSTTVTTILPPNERPFLSPELAVTTPRAGAFALDRRTPEVIPQPRPIDDDDDELDIPDSPAFSDNSETIGNLRVESTRLSEASDEEGEFQGGLDRLQEALAGDLSSDESFVSMQGGTTGEIEAESTLGHDDFVEMEEIAVSPLPSPVELPRTPRPSTPAPVTRLRTVVTPISTAISAAPVENAQPSPQSVLVDHLLSQRTSNSPESFFLSLENHYRSSGSSNATSATTTDSNGPRTPPLSPFSSSSQIATIIEDESSREIRFAADIERMQPLIDKLGSNIASSGIDMSRQPSDTRSFDSALTASLPTTLPLTVSRRSPVLSRANSALSAPRARGPPPPRPKRMRRPIDTDAMALVGVEFDGPRRTPESTGVFGSDYVTRQRGLFTSGDDIEDDGGGGGSAGARPASSRSVRYDYSASSYVSSGSRSSEGSRSNSNGSNSNASTPPLPSSAPASSTSTLIPEQLVLKTPTPPLRVKAKIATPPPVPAIPTSFSLPFPSLPISPSSLPTPPVSPVPTVTPSSPTTSEISELGKVASRSSSDSSIRTTVTALSTMTGRSRTVSSGSTKRRAVAAGDELWRMNAADEVARRYEAVSRLSSRTRSAFETDTFRSPLLSALLSSLHHHLHPLLRLSHQIEIVGNRTEA